eukprot:scaffold7625_cov277-Pinguiococcus_pyrenoidosus.AAC.11
MNRPLCRNDTQWARRYAESPLTRLILFESNRLRKRTSLPQVPSARGREPDCVASLRLTRSSDREETLTEGSFSNEAEADVAAEDDSTFEVTMEDR